MKKNRVVITAIFLFVMILCGVFGMKYYKNHNKNTAEAAFNSFIYALNHDDVNEMLEYIEPTEASIITTALDKIDELTDSQIATVLTKWLPFLSDFTEFDILPELSPRIISILENDDEAVITISLDEDEQGTLYDVYLIRIDKKWYIQYAWKSNFSKNGEEV